MNSLGVVDSQGRPIQLGAILGKGGEGTVYEMRQAPETVAKIYHKPLSSDREEKIRIMVAMRTEALSKFTSWPIDLIRTRSTGQATGLLMPRIVNRKNVHHLYGPKSRLQDFPNADWRFLVHAAANIARSFAVVHDSDCVVGDVNHGSIMVAEDATVRLIDCDSFQINTSNRQFLCEVGIETFTPPELQGISFRGAVRTTNYDNFGLAVMIFHLLFMGRHPFAGRFDGVGDMPIARAIKECRFPYGSNQKANQISPPPGTPPLSFVGGEISNLFETAFSQHSICSGRPTARTWVEALKRLEANTKRCASNPAHWHPMQLTECPWCRMEAQGAKPLFPLVIPTIHAGSGSAIDFDALWRRLNGLPAPDSPSLETILNINPSTHVQKLAELKQLCRNTDEKTKLDALLKRQKVISILSAVLIFVLFIQFIANDAKILFGLIVFSVMSYNVTKAFLGKSNAVKTLRSEIEKKSKELNYISSEIDRLRTLALGANIKYRNAMHDEEFCDAIKIFNSKKQNFLRLRDEISKLPERRLRSLEQLKQDQRKIQLSRFLDQFKIEDADIQGIGPGRKMTLESYGIETAEDIDSNRIANVPGFGPKMANKLIRWRRSVEAHFVFDSSKAIEPRDIARIEQDIVTRRSKIEVSAKTAFEEALQAHAKLMASRQKLNFNLRSLHVTAKQTQVDYEFLVRQ